MAGSGDRILAVSLLGADGWWRPSNTDRAIRPARSRPTPSRSSLPPPPIDDEYFPCSDCHEDQLADPERRELDEHDYIELAHGDLWCLDCHHTDQRDLLHLSDASPVRDGRVVAPVHALPRQEDPRLARRRHGKRTGNWWGTKGVPDLRRLSRPPFAALQAARAQAAAHTGQRDSARSRRRRRRPHDHSERGTRATSRRQFLKAAGVGVGALAGVPGAARPSTRGYFQAHFRELSQEDLEEVIGRLERKYSEGYGKPVKVERSVRTTAWCSATAWTSPAASAAGAASTPASTRTTSRATRRSTGSASSSSSARA